MKPPSVKINVLANYASQIWSALMGLAFVPLYIRYLGIEAYGLMGMFALLQSMLALLDMGISPTLSREFARFRGGAIDVSNARSLLRSAELVFAGLALAISLAIWEASNWFASEWVHAANLPAAAVEQAFAIMGFVVALRFFEGIYRGAMVGMQRQVLLSLSNAGLATVRGGGAAALIVWVSPTTTAFFLWQAAISIFSALLLGALVYSSLPHSTVRTELSIRALKGVRRFAGGMAGISVLSLLLTQSDKILLSKLLSLAEYGHYMLAATVANMLYMIVTPISQAFFPLFSELLARGDHRALVEHYHKAAQMVTVLTGSVAFVLMALGETALHFWTRDAALSRSVAPLLAVLSLGILCNCLMWIPQQMQLAHGIVGLALKTNLVAIAFVLPALFWSIPRFGPIGAGWVWVALNAGYLLITANLMYQRILGAERWRWYMQDLVLPLLALVLIGSLCRWSMPVNVGRFVELLCLLVTIALLILASGLAAPSLRQYLLGFVRNVRAAA
jgi:O-antigen/teichoic acid export membrane protein